MNVEKEKKDNGRVEKKGQERNVHVEKEKRGNMHMEKRKENHAWLWKKRKKGTQNNLETGCCATNTGQIIQEKIY